MCTPTRRLILIISVALLAMLSGCSIVGKSKPTPIPEMLIPTPPKDIQTVPTRARKNHTTDFHVPPQVALPKDTRNRFGFGVPLGPVIQYDTAPLGAGWYLDWQVEVTPEHPGRLEFVQMIRVHGKEFRPDPGTIVRAAEQNPGSLWLIGNEPDVLWQDWSPPEKYARVYHELYHLLKRHDPTCKIAIAGVSQPTPLRLEYLDAILDAYRSKYGEKMPVDVWNVHAFILREEKGSWGVGIPPSLDVTQGALYDIQDHDDMAIFREQIVRFRRWMKKHGEQDKPLIISEYGILMPREYGFSQERVREFMYRTFDYFLTAADREIGYPVDDYRLVQRWCWYSLSDTHYPTGNLFDPETHRITPLGKAFGGYIRTVAP